MPFTPAPARCRKRDGKAQHRRAAPTGPSQRDVPSTTIQSRKSAMASGVLVSVRCTSLVSPRYPSVRQRVRLNMSPEKGLSGVFQVRFYALSRQMLWPANGGARAARARRVERRKDRRARQEDSGGVREPYIPRLNVAEMARSAITTGSILIQAGAPGGPPTCQTRTRTCQSRELQRVAPRVVEVGECNATFEDACRSGSMGSPDLHPAWSQALSP